MDASDSHLGNAFGSRSIRRRRRAFSWSFVLSTKTRGRKRVQPGRHFRYEKVGLFVWCRHRRCTKGSRKRYDKTEDDNNFVRVLEFCNLIDHYVDPENPDIKYEGRLEIYVLGQGDASKKPVYVGPLPFARHDGEPMAHIIPLIFNYEPEYPLRGIAHVRRLMPQFKELNAYRS